MQDNIYSGPSGLFACYLLHSEVKEKAYIGYTPDPRQRLRKHNREIAGGARQTGRDGPWRMLLFVGGFATEVSALQFERYWQQPQDTKLTKLQIDSSASLVPAKCMATLQSMLQLKQWRVQPLRVCYLDLPWFQKYGMQIRGKYQPNYLYEKGNSVSAEQIYRKEERGACQLCQNKLSPYNCRCYCCQKQFCMQCMAQMLIADKNELIPDVGNCICGAEIQWREILKRKQIESITNLRWDYGQHDSENSDRASDVSPGDARSGQVPKSEDGADELPATKDAEDEEHNFPDILINGVDELCQSPEQPAFCRFLGQLTPEDKNQAPDSQPLAIKDLLISYHDARQDDDEVVSID